MLPNHFQFGGVTKSCSDSTLNIWTFLLSKGAHVVDCQRVANSNCGQTCDVLSLIKIQHPPYVAQLVSGDLPENTCHIAAVVI